MNEIRRFHIHGGINMDGIEQEPIVELREDGHWVEFVVHAAAVGEKEAEVERFRRLHDAAEDHNHYLREQLKAQATALGGNQSAAISMPAALLAWNRSQDKPPITVGLEYWVAEHALRMARLALGTVDQWAPSGADYDRAIHHNPDAMAWADLFVATFPHLADKHDLMLGWFANAMMAMHDHLAQKERSQPSPAPVAASQGEEGRECIARAFITGESGAGEYRVVMKFDSLADMQAAHNYLVRLPAAQPARQVGGDEQDLFESKFPMPAHCTRFPGGYSSTGYSAWDAHKHCDRWSGWKARAALNAPVVLMPDRKCFDESDGPFEENRKSGYNSALGEVARLNRRAIPVELLERLLDTGYSVSIANELRALLGKDGE